MGESSGTAEPTSNWVIKAIETRLEPGRRRAFIAIDDFTRCSKANPYYLRHSPLSDFNYAKLALRLFKKTKEFVPKLANYKVERALGSSRVLFEIPRFESLGVLDWCHVSFIAVYDSDQLLCFAELVDFGYGDQLLLNSFSFVNPNSSGLSYGCGICPAEAKYPHPPPVAYTAGRWDYRPIDVASQKELVVAFQNKVIKQEDLKGNRGCTFNLCDLPSDAYPRLKPPQFDPSNYTPMLLEKDYALIALSYINEKEGVDYEVATTWFAHCQIMIWKAVEYRMYCHVAFSAKPRNATTPRVYFFAEMKDRGERKFLLKGYCKFDPDDPNLMDGCGFCPKCSDYPHPSEEDFRYTMFRPRFSDFRPSM